MCNVYDFYLVSQIENLNKSDIVYIILNKDLGSFSYEEKYNF